MCCDSATSVVPCGGQSGQHQRGSGADVVGDHRGAGEHRDAADDGVVAVGAQVRAEPGQLLGEHEPRLEDVLGDHRGARGDRGQRHRERLQVGREAGVGQRRDVEGRAGGWWVRTVNPPSPRSIVGPGGDELVEHDVEVVRPPRR